MAGNEPFRDGLAVMARAPGIAPSRGVLETLQVTRPSAHVFEMERGPGVAPGLSGWKPDVLLLNTTRAWWSHRESHPDLRRAKATCCSYHYGPNENGGSGRTLTCVSRFCGPLPGSSGTLPSTGGAAGICTLSVQIKSLLCCCYTTAPTKWCAQGESHSRLRTGRPARCFYAMHA